MPSSRSRRTIALWLAATALVLGFARTVVALPEQCTTAPSLAAIDTSIDEAIGWFERNQRADGTWLYRFDGPQGVDLGGYNWTRHAGVLVSMEQAAAAGRSSAADIADRGWPVLLGHVTEVPTGLAVASPDGISTGGTALAGIALGERRLRTGDPEHDDTLRGVGRFVAGQVQADGRLWNAVDATTRRPAPGTNNPFAVGQAMFLLARLDRLFPGEGWGEPARLLGVYAATSRAVTDGYVPDLSDHWGAYALAELVSTEGVRLTGTERSFARRQMGIMGVQIRYESQRTNGGVDRWLRGRQTLGAGLGTIGEAIGAFTVVAAAEPGFEGTRAWLRERLLCTADLLVARQVGPAAAARQPDPSGSQGAWFQFGITQMDDTRHAMSALLAARPFAADGSGGSGEPTIEPRRTPVPASAVLVVLAAIAAINPGRLARAARGCTMVRPGIAGVAAIAGITALGTPLLRALSVGPATGVVAAGLVLVLAGLWAFVRPGPDAPADETGVLLHGVLRPEVVLASLAVGAGGQGWTWVLTASFVVLAAGYAASRPTPLPDRLLVWSGRLAAVLAVYAGVALVVDAVYAV
jgi:hypothetical protein